MISTRTVTDSRTGDVAVQAFYITADGTLLTVERVLRYVDVESPDRAKIIKTEENTCTKRMQRIIDAISVRS